MVRGIYGFYTVIIVVFFDFTREVTMVLGVGVDFFNGFRRSVCCCFFFINKNVRLGEENCWVKVIRFVYCRVGV